MMSPSHPTGLLHECNAPHHNRVGLVDLIFDLVFAITQASHHLLYHPTLECAEQAQLLLLDVWTVWVDTT
jgi:low temperature requirement protein LtrA